MDCTAHSPCGLEEGLNAFLAGLSITLRQDEHSGRPRVNKRGSSKDREQKQAGRFFSAGTSAARPDLEGAA